MKKVQVINERLPYGRRYLKPGEVVEMPDEDAGILIKIGRVKHYFEPVPPVAPRPEVRQNVITNKKKVTKKKKIAKKKTYQTRRMTADK